MVIYTCKDTFSDILCSAFGALGEETGPEQVRLELEGIGDMELFAVYRQAEVSDTVFREAVSQIRRRISPAVYEKVYLASLSRETDKADWIYRFLVSGFQYGSAVMEMLHLEEVSRIMKMCRFVQNESHLLTGFLRFAQAGGDLLIGRIGPKNDVLPLLAWHFSDRLAGENWMIYDEHRKKAVLHPAGGRWFVLNKEDEAWQEKLSWKTDEEEYQALWRTFHETAAIPERANALCQRTHLPLRYRPYMTEFQKGNPRGI